MARIRSIKPELPQSESMGRVSRDARLCFILLWTLADDEGRLRGNSRMLASLLFPYDDDAPKLIDDWLDELEAEECIVRYSVEGSTYMQICKWLIHQKIDKPSASKIPPFDESSRILANPSRRIKDLDQGSRIKDQGKDQGSTLVEQQAARPPAERNTRADQVAAVFAHWQKVMGHSKAKLDAKRQRLIEARLKDGYTVEDLCNAITGCSQSPFHMGQNEQGTRYDGIDLICRDGAKVDSFLEKFRNPPAPMGKQGLLEARNRAVGDAFVNGPDPWAGINPAQQGDIIDME